MTNYANSIFNTVVGFLPASPTAQQTRVMGLINLGTALTLPIGESTVVGNVEELATVVPKTSDTYLGGSVYFKNTEANTPQSNTLTIINVGSPTFIAGTASVLTGQTLGAVDDFKLINDGSFYFQMYNNTIRRFCNITGLDFTSVTSEEEIVAVINGNSFFSTIAIASVVSNKIVFTSLDVQNGTTFTLLTPATTGTDISGASFLNATAPVIINGVAGTENYATCITALETYLTDNIDTAPYLIAIPSSMVQDTAFLNFLNNVATTNPLTRFISDYITLTPTNDPIIQKYLNLPNIWIGYTIAYNEFCYCAMMGRLSRYIASTLYIMNNATLSPIRNITPADLNKTQKASFKLNNFNYVQLQSETNPIPSLQLGVFMDGQQYTDRYGIDTTEIYTNSQINNFIYQTNNIVGSTFSYNQQGLQTLLSQITVALNQCKQYGLIDDYLNLSFIPFLTYINTNPTDYSAGIYNGFTVTLRIREFFTEITLFANIGVA